MEEKVKFEIETKNLILVLIAIIIFLIIVVVYLVYFRVPVTRISSPSEALSIEKNTSKILTEIRNILAEMNKTLSE